MSSSADHCPHCAKKLEDPRRVFCPHCKKAIVDLKTIRFMGDNTLVNAKHEYFWKTGDPAVYAKPGALDYNPSLP